MSRAPIGFAVHFYVDGPVASKKNGRRWIKRGRRTFLVPNEKAAHDEMRLAAAARSATSGERPFDEFDELRIDYRHDLATDRLHVSVTKVGLLPTRGPKGTKRDTHGMAETIADALQGVIYPDDRQVGAGSWERTRENH